MINIEQQSEKKESKVVIQKVMNFVEEDWDITEDAEKYYLNSPLMRIEESFLQEEDMDNPKELDASQFDIVIEDIFEYEVFMKPLVDVFYSKTRPVFLIRRKEIKIETQEFQIINDKPLIQPIVDMLRRLEIRLSRKEFIIFRTKPIINPLLDIRPITRPRTQNLEYIKNENIETQENFTETDEVPTQIHSQTNRGLQTEPLGLISIINGQSHVRTVEIQSDLSQYFNAVTPVPGFLNSQHRYSPFLDSSYSIDFHDEHIQTQKSDLYDESSSPQSLNSSQVSFSVPIFDVKPSKKLLKVPVLSFGNKNSAALKIQALVKGWLTRRKISATIMKLFEYQNEVKLRSVLMAIRLS